MSSPRFHPDARREYVEALLHVEAQREGYGSKLEAEIEAMLTQIVELPRSGPRVVGFPEAVEARRFTLKTFRYALMVVLDAEEPVIYAVAHPHRHPTYWHSRVAP